MLEYLQAMDPSELLGLSADERLLDAEADNLPLAVGHPESLPPASPARARLVALGATLTGLSLLVGIALIAAGIGEAIANGIVLAIAAIAVGLLLIGTHWGWVHVAEWRADAIERRRNHAVLARRQEWLRAIEPYARHEVSTAVGDDGSITIVSIRKLPVASGENTFTFKREVEAEEVHSAEEPGAAVAERAEMLRRRAAADTERERERFELASDAYEAALMRSDDEEQQRIARRAASQALSEQINTNLREPPLTE